MRPGQLLRTGLCIKKTYAYFAIPITLTQLRVTQVSGYAKV